MGEIAANTLTENKFIGFSAGSHPIGEINDAALDIARDINYPLDKLESKNLSHFINNKEYSFDIGITVCDNAKESCPVFMNCSKILHWSYPDPAKVHDFQERKKELLRIYYDIGDKLNNL
jgi:arsenate reductase|tara:strand:- start:221 stop:580 length:360 start_codon:yes stop_codon:yes gene_type:complete